MKQRKALALPPTYETIEDKQDAYLHPLKLRPLAKQHGRFWSFHSVPTTVALPNNCYAKSLKAFTSHTDEASFRDLLREYSEYGCPRPSGYADVFYERFHSPRVSWSVNAQLAPAFAGGWQSAIDPGRHGGTHYRYDMRSAYLWAATLGMPDTRTYTHSLTPWKAKYDGVFRVKLLRPSVDAPFPYNIARECLATNQEIELYNLSIGEVVDGVIWKSTTDPEAILDAIKCVSTWKLAARCYWGRWAQLQRVECNTKDKRWNLPNIALNIPWAHLIVSRVKMRLWEYARRAVHVFVDSVITSEKLPTGNNVGDWRHERTYPLGVIIKGPGQYGCIEEARLEKMAGYGQNAPERYTSVGLAS